MEIVQPIPTRAKIARAWLEHAHSFDRCVREACLREDTGNWGEIGKSETNIFKPKRTIVHLGSEVTLSSSGDL